MIRRLMLFTALLATVLAPLSLTVANARQSANAATPADAAVFYSQLEANGSFESLYQWMHPEAQSIVPASAVVGWYTNEFAPSGPGVITVTGVTMTTWTWEVTGQTYPNTAEVSFTQPFANGTVVEDVVRLVENNGEWRWFFGRNREFVDAQIARYGDQHIVSGEVCTGAAEWWAETYPRLLAADYFMSALPEIWGENAESAQLLRDFSDLFAELHYVQSLNTPPFAATELQADILETFEILHRASNSLAAVAGGNTTPLMEAATFDAGMQGIHKAGGIMLSIGSTIDTFLLECEPVVVFVVGSGESLPMAVFPGQVGNAFPSVSCSDFTSQQQSQRFFEAALPGDPHGLDQDADGIACNTRPRRDAGSSSTVSLYTTPGMTLTPRSHRTAVAVHMSASEQGLLVIVLPKGLEASASSGCVNPSSMTIPTEPLCATRTVESRSGETSLMVEVPAGNNIYSLTLLNLSMDHGVGEIRYRYTVVDEPTQHSSTLVDSGSD